MTRFLCFLAVVPITWVCLGQAVAGPGFTLRVEAPQFAGKPAVLYRYDDLLTLRTQRIAAGRTDAEGRVELGGEATGTDRVQLRIGDVFADLFVRPGSDLHLTFPPPGPRTALSISGTTRTSIVFHDLDPLDINALVSDLNEKLDDFMLEDLATDAAAGMQAVDLKRRDSAGTEPPTERPATLFVLPDLSAARVDSFETALRRYYRGVDDPWFKAYLEYGVAGLRHGPRINDKDLWERYVRGRAIAYDNPEQLRFLHGLFAETLTSFAIRHHEDDLLDALRRGDPAAVDAVFARHDFLKDERLRELVLLEQLYLNHANKLLQGADVRPILRHAAETSRWPEHRRMAANMLWDLTAMRDGSMLPAVEVEDLTGRTVRLDSLLGGGTYLFITASWCTYCTQELLALDQLHKDNKGIIPVIVLSLDADAATTRAFLKQRPLNDFTWLRARDEVRVRDDLRIRSLPSGILMNDGVITGAPAPPPSGGLGAVFHRARVEAEKAGRTKVWDD